MNASPRAFSLAETLLAIAVASSAALAVIGLLAGALNTALDCRRQTAAGLLAQRLANAWQADSSSPEILLVDQALQPLLSRREQVEAAEAAYANGSPLPAAAHFARIDQLPPAADPQPGAARLRIRVESPASAPAGQRRVHTYVTLALP